MYVQLAYGRHGLDVTLPESADVIEPRFLPRVKDEADALRQCLRQPIASPPLAELVNPGDTVVVVHTDITRATPNHRILPVLLAELEAAGVGRQDITLLNGLGTHRPQTESELRSLLGPAVVENYRCLQHDCFDDSNLVSLGETPLGHPVRINRAYLQADVKVLTGFIEPHFFAGFSGGPKAVLPSLAGAESVFTNHGLNMIGHPKATWGVTEGNPIWEEMRAVALRTQPTFLLNVALNTRHEITGIFAGDMLAAHRTGCQFVRQAAMIPVSEPYDVVITTNGGYPLDQNLYQAVKGMSAAVQILRGPKEGIRGAIILVAACEDGLPDHGKYASLLAEAGSPQGVLDLISQPGFSAHDQWQIQIQAQIQLQADVHVYSDGLTDAQISAALLTPCRDIPRLLAELGANVGLPSAGNDGQQGLRICVLPQGPQTIPYLSGSAVGEPTASLGA